jgi:hypothetical protein
MKRGKMAYLVAKIDQVGGRGDFLEKHEETPDTIEDLYDSEQPPLFQPRDEWSHWDPKTFEYPYSDDDDDLIKSKLGKDELQRNYYVNPAHNVTWEEHARCLWNMHQDLEEESGKMLLNDSLSAVLRMLGNGLEKVVTVARFEIIIQGKYPKLNSENPEPTPFLPDNYERVVKCNTDQGFGGYRRWREACCGRRFYAGFVFHAYNKHFTSFIWDRKEGDFYHFDSLSNDQMVRAKNVGLAWREHLAKSGQPFEFNFHAIPLTPQQGDWECGLISTYCLFQTLRGLVGVTCTELKTICPPKTLKIDGKEEAPLLPFDLLVRDWLLDNWTTGGTPRGIKYQDNLDSLRGVYQTIVTDELGIKDGRFMKRTSRTKIGMHESLYADLINYTPLEYADRVPKHQLYTDLGGYVIAGVRDIGHISNWRTNRLITAPQIEEGEEEKVPTGAGPFAVLLSGITLPDLPADVIKWYTDNGIEVRGNMPIYVDGQVISDSDDSKKKKKLVAKPTGSTSKNDKDKFTTPAPPQKKDQPWTPSKPLADLSLSTPKRSRPPSNSGSEFQPSEPSTSSEDGKDKDEKKASAEPSDQMVDVGSWGKTRDGRPYVVEEGPKVRGAKDFNCSDYESDENSATKRRATGPGTKAMSIAPGEKGWLGEVGNRPTQRLLTGNYATHLPNGIVRPSQWDEILAAAAQPLMPATASRESRDERMRKRQKSRDN